MTPGRVSESLAAAGTSSLGNALLHVDWNQASIDSNHVCRDGDAPGGIRAVESHGVRLSARTGTSFTLLTAPISNVS